MQEPEYHRILNIIIEFERLHRELLTLELYQSASLTRAVVEGLELELGEVFPLKTSV